ncbi:MAG: hypothetical protein VX970_12225 [Planctomycetota bacterium]|nr:hypothetical protein [Planctomycetota bacterium]
MKYQPECVGPLWRFVVLVVIVTLLGANFVFSASDLHAADSDQNELPSNGRKNSTEIQSPGLTKTEALAPRGVTVEEVGPEIYYVPDKEGQLRAAVLNEITFEEFKQLLGNRAAARATPPQYVLSELRATGEVTEQTANLQIVLRLKNLSNDKDQWVPVPLKMANLVFSSASPIGYEGQGDFYLNFNEEREEYVLWIRGGGNKTQLFRLQGKVLLQGVGNEKQFRLRFPRATQSICQLEIRKPDQTVRILSGGTLQEIEQIDGRTEVRLEGVTGELRLAWRPTVVRNAPRMQALDVVGRQRIRMDGGLIRTEADLTIQSFAGSFDRFRVKLPQGARLITDNSAGYSFQVNDDLGDESGEWVDVKLDQRTRGPVDIQLVTQQIRDLSRIQDATPLAGFDVEGSIRQSGRIDVFVVGDWYVRWQEDSESGFDIRRVDAPDDSPVPQDWVASFEYYRQPYSLNAKIEPPETEVIVEPEYYFDVGRGRIFLEARCKYRVRGARVFHLDIDMRDWNILPDGIGPVEKIEADGIKVGTDGRLNIPFKRAAEGDFEIVVRAERPLPISGDQLTLPLPHPTAGRVDTTVAVVSPADDIELIPGDRDQLQERVPQAVKAKFADRRQEPLVYRYDRDELVPDDITAEVKIKQQQLNSAMDVRIEMNPDEMVVRQELRLNIEYQRLDSIELSVPRSLIEEKDLITRGGNSLSLLAVDKNSSADHVQVRVPLENAIGEVLLQVLYQKKMDELEPDALASVTVPLVIPASVKTDENRLTLVSEDGIEMDPLGEQWERTDETDAAMVESSDSSTARYRCDEPIQAIDLLVGLSEDFLSSQVVVRRGFLQSWLAPQSRYDRVTLLLENNGSYLDVEFPEEITRSAIGVWLNRRRADIRWLSAQQLRISLGSSATHVLEMEWQTPIKEPSGEPLPWKARELPMPKLSSNVQIQRPLYWQVVLPQMHHLLAGPQGAIPYHQWKWQRAGWRRVPLVGDRELSQWAGADALQSNFPGDTDEGNFGINRYLFRLTEWPSELSIRTVPRTLLVLVPAGLVLALGIAGIYFPTIRRTEIAFFFAVALLAAGLIYPEPAAMVVQMALLGAILVMLVWSLRRVFRIGSPRRYVVERNTGSSHRQRTTEFHYFEDRGNSSVAEQSSEGSSTRIGSVEGVSPLDGSVAEPKP